MELLTGSMLHYGDNATDLGRQEKHFNTDFVDLLTNAQFAHIY